MAASLLRRNNVVLFLNVVRRTSDTTFLTSNRSIMTSRARLEKVLDDLQKNPYFEKYAQKIAKMQETSPEEFMERIEEKERKIKEGKVFSRCLKQTQKSQWSWSVTSHLWRSNVIRKQSVVRTYSQHTSTNKYITTPIFYVNSVPHIGHLYSAVLADAIARFNLMQGHVTLLSTGTDEHGNKVSQAAKALNLSTDKYCQTIAKKFEDMCDFFNIEYTTFIRTTEPHHSESVKHFWNLLEEKNFIYKGKYSGWYCVSDEAFLSHKDIVEKKMPSGETIKVSAESGNVVEWAEEENYKFRLSAFQDDLKYWLKDKKVVQPLTFHKILSQWIEDGSCLADLSVSRPINRAPWGIPTPNDPNQTVYVWLDALVNYLTSVGYPHKDFKKFWPPTVQVIGKDILKFHGVYWPAFLIAAGLEPPKTLFCHSHWTVNGEKMSKSKGNVVSPFDAAEMFTISGLRYFLLRDSVPHNDANYSTERVLNILNSELADTLGNLVSRCTGKVVNPTKEIPSAMVYYKFLKSEQAEILLKNIETLGDVSMEYYKLFYIHHVVDAVMETLRSANAMIDHHKPWKLIKVADEKEIANEIKAVIALSLEAVRISALVLYPIIPTLSTDLLDFLEVPIDTRSWEYTKPTFLSSLSSSEPERYFQTSTKFFPRINMTV